MARDVAAEVELLHGQCWLCFHCQRPMVLRQAMKLLAQMVEKERHETPAYYDLHERRDAAPLLEDLATNISTAGGKQVAICNGCHRRGTQAPAITSGKYGSPTDWDGMCAVFLTLAERYPQALSDTDRQWAECLESFLARRAGDLARIPVSDYVRAFVAAQPFAEHESKLLKAHLSAPGHRASANELAKMVGWDSYRSVNMHYGGLAGRLCEALGKAPKYHLQVLITSDKPTSGSDQEWRLILRPAVVEALRQIVL